MSENITHTAVTDECRRLTLHSEKLPEPLADALRRHPDVARLGGVTRWGDRFTVTLLERFSQAHPEGEAGAPTRKKLSFVLGWLCHRAADRQFKPVFRALDPDCQESPTDCSVYHDVFLFGEVYGEGTEEPYHPDLLEHPLRWPPASQMTVQRAEELFRLFLQRGLLALHTFIPDDGDIEAWLERLFEKQQRFRVDVGRYAEALTEPDPDKVRRFIREPNFYDPEDPLIRLAASLRGEGPAEVIEFDAALETAREGSLYAQVLRRGCLYLQAAGEFFEGRIARDEVNERLDIGKPGG